MSPDELDKEISEAMEALDATTPDGYFDALQGRLEARFLEVEREMAGPTMVNDRSGDAAPDRPPPSAPAPGDGTNKTSANEENSGLHDIKALASSTKQRISRRVSTQSDVEESLLTSSSSALSTVALPDPEKQTEQPVLAAAAAAADAPARTARSAEETRSGLPTWIYATVGAVAVAAVVFFIVTGGKSDSAEDETVASADTSASGAGDTTGTTPPAGAMPAGDDGDSTASTTEPGGLVPDQDDDEAAESGEPDDAVAGEEEPGEPAAEAAGDREVVASNNNTGATRRDRDRAANRHRDRARTTERANRGGGGGAAGHADPAPAGDKDDGSDKGGEGDSIEDLLAQASGGAAEVGGDAPKEPAKPTKKRLTASDIKKGMHSITGKVPACYDGEPGTVKVRFTVEPSGKVSSALPTGKWKSTKSGNCIAGLVRSVSFPAWDGRPKSYTYPFLLSQ